MLDTNVPSETTRLKPDPRVILWLETQDPFSLYLSVMSVGELRRGIVALAMGRKRRELEDWLSVDLISVFYGRILPIDLAIAERWGTIRTLRSRQGLPLQAEDGLIAATALEHDFTLVTRNTKDFEGLGLTIVNPWID